MRKSGHAGSRPLLLLSLRMRTETWNECVALVSITMCSWQAERGTGQSRLQWNDFCYSRRNKCQQNAKLLINHYFWCLMLEFARVLVCCSFHSCDSHPSTSLQLRGVRVQSISLKSGSAISIIDILGTF